MLCNHVYTRCMSVKIQQAPTAGGIFCAHQLPFKLFLIYSLVSVWEIKKSLGDQKVVCPEIRAVGLKRLISTWKVKICVLLGKFIMPINVL